MSENLRGGIFFDSHCSITRSINLIQTVKSFIIKLLDIDKDNTIQYNTIKTFVSRTVVDFWVELLIYIYYINWKLFISYRLICAIILCLS